MPKPGLPRKALPRPSMKSLLSVIEALFDNVAIVSGDGVMLWVSPCFERTYGLSSKNIVGRTTYELEADRVFSPSVAALVLKTKRVATLTEVNQAGRYHIVTGVPVYDDDGKVDFVVSYTVDSRYLMKMQAEHERINTLLENEYTPQIAAPEFFCASERMRGILETITKLAKVDTSVLITGESGVGKNVLARLLHQFSERSAGPLVEINCAGIPDALLESELFGYEAGAFTGARTGGKPGRIELADKGTLFLDEIGELPLSLQTKLLQVIQEKQIVKVGGTKPIAIDFRLVTATNQDLRSLVEMKRFRSDLFFRLNVLPVEIPPLRERPEDILPLCRFVLDEMNVKYGTRKQFSPPARGILQAYSWPGNVRELRNLVEQLVVVSQQNTIEARELPKHMHTGIIALQDKNRSLSETLEEVEGQLVRKAHAAHGTTVAVGKALGISQPSAARKIAKYCKKSV